MEERSGAEILLGVPPVARAGRATTGAENTLVHAVELGPILLTLENLFSIGRGCLSLEPGFDALVLIIKIGHVDHQVFDDEHVRQGRDGGGGVGGGVDLGEAGEAVAAVDVHGTGSADALSAGAPEGERGVCLVLDLDQGVEHHGPALLCVYRIVLQPGLLYVLRIPSIDRKSLRLRCLRLCCRRSRAGREETGENRTRAFSAGESTKHARDC